ncbi:accessory factor UbiK family protein [Teredinibacter sp. KSP-S5-2]|uniref:accessory factor UbiK family protein n=1 Tax=Teredinibacter sp. KSP-S5-2 TaxID=3034506 RepID=UPI002934A4CB|nr:accessory factor UbiK family protein [Teredinibacter sp. KSP-S5-2]WNO09011.1 accessory factor UbiK family protein [Teredinibacter sp. KSP-S5-2]
MINEVTKTLLNEARDIFSKSPAQAISAEANSKFRALLEAQLKKMNLVTREEFDTQKAILERTRAKLEMLENKLAQIEKQEG